MIDKLLNTFGTTIKLTKYVTVSSFAFADLFKDAESFTYDELMKIEEENNYGYKKYIKQWEEEGILDNDDSDSDDD